MIKELSMQIYTLCTSLHFSSYLTLVFMTCALHSKHSLTAAKNNKQEELECDYKKGQSLWASFLPLPNVCCLPGPPEGNTCLYCTLGTLGPTGLALFPGSLLKNRRRREPGNICGKSCQLPPVFWGESLGTRLPQNCNYFLIFWVDGYRHIVCNILQWPIIMGSRMHLELNMFIEIFEHEDRNQNRIMCIKESTHYITDIHAHKSIVWLIT